MPTVQPLASQTVADGPPLKILVVDSFQVGFLKEGFIRPVAEEPHEVLVILLVPSPNMTGTAQPPCLALNVFLESLEFPLVTLRDKLSTVYTNRQRQGHRKQKPK